MKTIAVLILTFATLILSQQTYDVQVGASNQPRFTPNNLAIVVGDSVRFTFVTSPHTATHGFIVNCTRNANPFFDFSSASGSTATKVFTAVGDYPFISTSGGDCQNGMTGTITVRAQGTTPSPKSGPSPIGGSPSNTSGTPRPPATPPPTVPSPAPGPAPSPATGCSDGAFRCNNADFQKCDRNTWIDFKCPPGTACKGISSAVIMCDFAGSGGSGGSGGGGTGGTVSAQCNTGAFQCAGSDFQKCDNGSWILFKCAPGTACKDIGNSNILCDYPGSPPSGTGSPSRR